MDPAAPPARLRACSALDEPDLQDNDDLENDALDEADDNYGDDLQDDTPEPDPIEAAIAKGAAPLEVLRLIRVAFARQAAFLEWIHLHPHVYSMTRQLELARAVGRRSRILSGLAQLILTEMRDGPEPDPPPEVVDRLVGLLRDEVLTVLDEVASPAQAELFRQRLDTKMAEPS